MFESLNEAKGFDDLKAKIKRAILSGVAVAAIFAAIGRLDIDINEKLSLKRFAQQVEMQQDSTTDSLQMKNDTLFDMKVEACKAYMEYALKNQGYDISATKLSPEEIVRTCDTTGFDLPFVMAVAHQESCFGAKKRAQRTNSVFSVGSYDNGQDVCTYSDPNQSIKPFINLIKNDYLVDDKTISDLLAPGKFVNKDGNRYASDKKYEGKIKSIMNRIIKMYPILGS